MQLIVTRPLEDAGPLRAKLKALGHEVTVAPLMTIKPREGALIPERPWAFAVATSANAIRSLSRDHRLKSLRILTVGPQSLAAARQAGFTRAEAHGGDVKGLARFIQSNFAPNQGPILYLSGAETTGDLMGTLTAHGFDCARVILYDAAPASDLGTAAVLLKSGDPVGVLLYSPRSARIWHKLVTAEGLLAGAAKVHYLCLSANVADVLPENWRKYVAGAPEEAKMLTLLEQIGGTL
jgi:uroporphyrinogen-III synthase